MKLHRSLYRKGLTLAVAVAEIESQRGQSADADIDAMLSFIAAAERGIVR